MDILLFEKALKKLGNEYRNESVDGSTLAFLEAYKIPPKVVNFLKAFSFDRTIKFNKNSLYRINDIPEENSDFPNEKCIQAGLLILGYGLNGDYIVLNIEALTVGYVFHDELYENEETDIRDIFIDMKCTLGKFFLNSLEVQGYPIDGYQAETYMNESGL